MTRRTKTELDTIFGDNTQGLISAADARDFIESTVSAHGSLMMVTPAPTSIAVADTYYKAAGTTQLSTQTTHHEFDHPVSNRLRYTGVATIHAHIVASISMTAGGNQIVTAFKIAKNGVPLDHSRVQRKVSTGTDIGSTALHGDCTLSTNDYIELYLTNSTNTDTVTVDDLYLFVATMLM